MATSNINALMPGGSAAPQPVDVAGSLSSGLATGVKLATMSDEVQQKKAQTQAMQDELALKQINIVKSGFDSVVKSSDQVAKALIPMYAKKIAQVTGADPKTIEDNMRMHRADPDIRNQYMTMSNALIGKPFEPGDLADVLQYATDPEAVKSTLSAYTTRTQAEAADKRAAANNEAALQRAIVAAGSREKVADKRVAGMQEGQISREFNKIVNNPLISKRLTNLDLLNKGESLITKYKGSEKGMPISVLNDVSADIASGLRAGGSSGVGERSKTAMENFNTRLAEFVQHNGPGVAYVNDPELIQLAEDTLASVKTDFAEDITNHAKTLFRKSGNGKFNQTQLQAIRQIEDRAHGFTTNADEAIAEASGEEAAVTSGTTSPPPASATPAPSQTPAPANMASLGNGKSIDVNAAAQRATLSEFRKHYPNAVLTPAQEKLFKP